MFITAVCVIFIFNFFVKMKMKIFRFFFQIFEKNENLRNSYKLLFLGHCSLIKKITQTVVRSIVFQRILYNLTFRMLVNIHFQSDPLQFLKTIYHKHQQTLACETSSYIKNALKYNVYHPCLCYFLLFVPFSLCFNFHCITT